MQQSIYERYCYLRDKKGVKDSEVSTKTKITKSTFSDWKAGRYIPKQEKLQKIADYFGVSVDYLMTGKEESKDVQFDYTVRFEDKDYLLEMLDKAKKLENEHDKELLTFMIETLIKKNKE